MREAALQRWSYKKAFWKYEAHLQGNTHTLAWVFSSKFAVFFRRYFPKNASGGLLLSDPCQKNPYYGIFYVVLCKKYLWNIGLVRIKGWQIRLGDKQKPPPELFCKKRCSRNFAKFTEKHLCQSLLLIKLQLYQKKTLAQGFSCEFCEISKNIFFKEYFWAAASGQKAVNLKPLTYLVTFMEQLMKDRAKLKYMFRRVLKMQSYKLYNSKYMTVLIQITNTEVFAFVAVLVFKVGISPSQKKLLFASIIALQKWWKMLFISS